MKSLIWNFHLSRWFSSYVHRFFLDVKKKMTVKIFSKWKKKNWIKEVSSLIQIFEVVFWKYCWKGRLKKSKSCKNEYLWYLLIFDKSAYSSLIANCNGQQQNKERNKICTNKLWLMKQTEYIMSRLILIERRHVDWYWYSILIIHIHSQ